jgi:small conductance mechanosensitive channel
MTTNIVWIAAEVLLLLVGCMVLNRLLLTTIQRLGQAPFLKDRQPQIERLQHQLRRVMRWIPLVFSTGVIAANGVLLYRGEDVPTYTLALVQRIPQDFWQRLALGGVQTLGVSIGAVLLLLPLSKVLRWGCDRTKQFEQITANDASIEAFFTLLRASLVTTLWSSVVIAAAYFFGLPAAIPTGLLTLLKIYLMIAAGRLTVRAIVVMIDSLDALSLKYSQQDNWLRFYDRLRHLVPSLKRSLEFIIYVVLAMGVVHQISAMAQLADYGPKVVRIIGIIFLSRLLVEVANLAIEEIMLQHQDLTDLQRQRRLTIIPLMQSVARYALYFSAGIAILDTLGINPTPILAGAGIVGLAVGFGAQNLINDMVCGFFILFENYYLVGDFVETNQTRGWVEAIDLRTTRLRHPDGQVHIIRNGQMEPIINYSKQYVNAVVTVGVDYDSNLDQVYEVLETVGRTLQQQCSDVISPTQVAGLDQFGESELVIRTVTRVKPGSHLSTQRLLRKLIKDAFDTAGIEIPFARRVLIFKPDQDADATHGDTGLPELH